MFEKYTVHILECSDNSFYVGVTNDIERRMQEHKSGINKKSYTYSRRPMKLVYQEHFQNIKEAIAWEKQVKGWRRAKKIALINGEWHLLPELSKSYRERKK